MESADVIVVGAGFASTAAAREHTGLGHRLTVLEARDRVRVRTWTGRMSGSAHHYDCGTWISAFSAFSALRAGAVCFHTHGGQVTPMGGYGADEGI